MVWRWSGGENVGGIRHRMTAPGENGSLETRNRLNTVSSIQLRVEPPVGAFERSALQSSWIQRLKAVTTLHTEICDEETLQIPLKRLALGKSEAEDEMKNNQVQEFLSRINLRTEDDNRLFNFGQDRVPRKPKELGQGGFGSYRMKTPNVKYRKPPLPPTKPPSRTENSGDAWKKNLFRVESRLKVHALDVRLEKLHRQQQDRTRPKDLLADFASRLDIKEKPTPVGLFHVADRKNKNKQSEKHTFPGLTPVIYSRGDGHAASSTTASLTPDKLWLFSKGDAFSRVGAKDFSMLSVEANPSHASIARTHSTACCGSSPVPADDQINEVQLERYSEVDEMTLASGKRRLEHSVNLINEECRSLDVNVKTKRSRLCVQGDAKASPAAAPALAGPWLNRWTLKSGSGEEKEKEQQVFGRRCIDHKGEKFVEMEAPSAAAMAIVGAAVRRLQTYSLERQKDVV